MKRKFRKQLQSLLLRPESLFRLWLKARYGTGPRSPTSSPALLPNAVLQSTPEWQAALAETRRLHLPTHRGPEKSWDHLAAIAAISHHCPPDANILDAGAELYSNVLPALFLLGFRNLFGVNLSFPYPTRRGPIQYEPGDITRLRFPDNFFSAVTCLSVIEHGVLLEPYLREMYRVLQPGGLLITSTDYYPTPIDTHGAVEHGAPIKIFTQPEILDLLELAKTIGFEATGPLDLACTARPVRWAKFHLDYTFLVVTHRKPNEVRPLTGAE